MGIETMAALAIGAAAASAMAPKGASAPATPAAPEAPPAQQAAKTPDAATVKADNAGTGQAGGSPGVASTFLTGAGGVDPTKLMLGKSTLLGS